MCQCQKKPTSIMELVSLRIPFCSPDFTCCPVSFCKCKCKCMFFCFLLFDLLPYEETRPRCIAGIGVELDDAKNHFFPFLFPRCSMGPSCGRDWHDPDTLRHTLDRIGALFPERNVQKSTSAVMEAFSYFFLLEAFCLCLFVYDISC